MFLQVHMAYLSCVSTRMYDRLGIHNAVDILQVGKRLEYPIYLGLDKNSKQMTCWKQTYCLNILRFFV